MESEPKTDRFRPVIAGALFAVMAAAGVEAQRSPCPGNGRLKIENAGKSNVTTVQCAQFTIDILGQTLSTPASCVDSFVFRDASEFGCGRPSPGNYCEPRDHKVTVKIFGPTNTCPTFPDPLPTTLKDASKALECGEPKLVRQTFNWSAGEYACKGGAAVLSAGEGSVAGPDGCVFCEGAPDDLLGASVPGLLEPWYAALETVNPATLPSPLREVYVMSPTLPAAWVVSKVSIAYPPSGEVYDYDVSGYVAGDGRFAVQEVGVYDHPDGDARIALDLSFDHLGFYVGQQGRPVYCAYAASRDDVHGLMLSLGASVMPLLDWVDGPCRVSLLEDVQRTTEVATVDVAGESVEVVRVSESIPGSGWNGSRVYDIAEVDGRFQPLTIKLLDANGGLVSCKRLSDYTEFEPGGYHFRPATVVVEDYEPGVQQPFRVVTLRVAKARRAVPSDVPTWRRGSSLGWWHVFR
ncbi:MAG TPA: hypothetical protein ENI87_00140 [bacterium]|nr:hypothetical protein [bacterium]